MLAKLPIAPEMAQVAISVDLASNSLARFRDQAEQAAVNSLTEFFDSGLENAKNLKDAFRSLAASIVSDLKRIAAQALATSLVKGLSGAFGGGGGAVTAATGGLFIGPGTGTSDSIDAKVSRGEFLVRAASVSQPGVLNHLRYVNRHGRIPHFAEGGLVGDSPLFRGSGLAESGTLGSAFSGRLEIGLADGLDVKAPPVSDRMVIDVIRRNPRRIGEALGR